MDTTFASRHASSLGAVAFGLLVLLTVVCAPGVSAADAESPSVTASNNSVQEGSTATVNITLSNVPNGVAGYDIAVAVADTSTATISNASVASQYGLADVTVSEGQATLTASDVDRNVQAGEGPTTLGTLVVSGVTDGETSLSVNVTQLDADGGARIDAVERSATVTVTADDGTGDMPTVPDQLGPAGNLDSDQRLEDITGDGRGNLFDALAYYNQADSPAIRDNPVRFDFDGDGTAGTVFDAIALYQELTG